MGDLLDELNVPASPRLGTCPKCSAALPAGAVLCVTCGYHLEKGKALLTQREGAKPKRSVEEQMVADAGAMLARQRSGRRDGGVAAEPLHHVLTSVVCELICGVGWIAAGVVTLAALYSGASPGLALCPFCLLILPGLGAIGYGYYGRIGCFQVSPPGTGRFFILGWVVLYSLTLLIGLLARVSEQTVVSPGIFGYVGASICWFIYLWRYSLSIGRGGVAKGALLLAIVYPVACVIVLALAMNVLLDAVQAEMVGGDINASMAIFFVGYFVTEITAKVWHLVLLMKLADN